MTVRRRRITRRKYMRPNPPKGSVKIYDNVLEVRALKGPATESHFPGEPFKHPFDERSKVCLYGCPDGTLRLIGNKPLWKYFEYSDADIQSALRD